jgi:hypothetical protein
MIYDIKVFDKDGKLKDVINGYEVYQQVYGESDAPNATVKGYFVCKYCNVTVEQTRTSKVTCGSRKCRNEHARLYKKRIGVREITCRICKTKLKVTQSRQITCSKECSEENNRRVSAEGARRRYRATGEWNKKREVTRKYKTPKELA